MTVKHILLLKSHYGNVGEIIYCLFFSYNILSIM